MLKSIVARPLARVLALGAVHLVLSLAMMSTVVMAQSDTTTYIIRPGDNLRRIAAAHNTTMQAILALNPGITNADRIYVGTTILLPGAAEEEAEPGPATAVCSNTYTTVAGDTFTSIARKFNVDASTLVVVNHPSVVAWLAVGTELCIPTAAVAGETQTSALSDPTDVPEAGQGEGRWYTIQRGDYLSRIAGSAGCSTSLLVQINNISNPSLVFSGQRIWIPASCSGIVAASQPAAAPTPAPAPAPVPFVSVSTGWDHTCGMQTNGTLACWGKNDFGQTLPPDGVFVSVSAGWGHTCGMRANGTLACWGRNDFGQALPPDGAFASVSAGWGHTCGMRTNGALACWGRNNYGQALSPDGVFNFISSGWGHACGIRTDGTVACWGKKRFWTGFAAGWRLHLHQFRRLPYLWHTAGRHPCLLGTQRQPAGPGAGWLLHCRQRRMGPHLRDTDERHPRLLGEKRFWAGLVAGRRLHCRQCRMGPHLRDATGRHPHLLGGQLRWAGIATGRDVTCRRAAARSRTNFLQPMAAFMA